MKKIITVFGVGIFTVSAIQAGNVTIENKNISVNKCVIKFHNEDEARHTSNAAPASVVLGIGKAGDKLTKEIPNEVYQGIILECEMSDNQEFSEQSPKRMAYPKLRATCNAENPYDPIGTAKTLHITKNSPTIDITIEKPYNSFNSTVMKNNFSCKINNLSELN